MQCSELCELLLSGNVQLHHGPKSDQAQQLQEMPDLLYDVNDRSVKLKEGQ